MHKTRCRAGFDSGLIVTALVVATSALTLETSRADEGGVSFWVPGLFGSLAAVPGTPGLSLVNIVYHTSVEGGRGTFFRGRRFVVGLEGDATVGFLNPSYTFAQPVLGGQLNLGVATVVGHQKASIDATVTGPRGNTISGSATDTVTGFGDLIPMATLKWNHGVHNFMTYMTGDIPVGTYDPDRLANMSIGHAAIDGGFGYTYFDPSKGHELSAGAGLTYNFENEHTQYKNGLDWHLDWGASQFLSKQLHIGLVGYAYQQLTCDSGAGARLGCFESRVFGVGPQVGYFFPLGEWKGYLNLKGYGEFGHENRPEGWNVWLTFAILPADAPPPPVHKSVIRK
jgi:hypothetical protein